MRCLGLSFDDLASLWLKNPGAVAYLTAKHGGKQLCAALGAALGVEYVQALCKHLELLQVNAEVRAA